MAYPLRMPDEVLKALKHISAETGHPIRTLILEAIKSYVFKKYSKLLKQWPQKKKQIVKEK